MTKQYIDLKNGQLVFADPLKVTDTFSPLVTTTSSKNGVGIVRWGAKQLINTRMGQPGCEDKCNTFPFARRYDLSVSGNLPQSEAEALILKAELQQFMADINVLIASKIQYGIKPSVSTTFPDIK